MKLYGIDDEVILSGYGKWIDFFVLDTYIEVGLIFPMTTLQIVRTDITSSPVLISRNTSHESTMQFAS